MLIQKIPGVEVTKPIPKIYELQLASNVLVVRLLQIIYEKKSFTFYSTDEGTITLIIIK